MVARKSLSILSDFQQPLVNQSGNKYSFPLTFKLPTCGWKLIQIIQPVSRPVLLGSSWPSLDIKDQERLKLAVDSSFT